MRGGDGQAAPVCVLTVRAAQGPAFAASLNFLTLLIGVFLGHILCCFPGGIAGRKGK